MTIGHPPQREEKDLRTSHLPRTSTPVARCLKELFFIFYLFYFQFTNISTHCFYKTLKSKLKIHHFESLQIILYEENPSLCSTLEPIYCSSSATTVGGILGYKFVDSGTPTVARISFRSGLHQMKRLRRTR